MRQKVYKKNENDFRCAYYKRDNSWYIMWDGGEFDNGTGVESFKEHLLSHCNACKDEHVKVFLNDIRVMKEVFSGKVYGEHKRGEHSNKIQYQGMVLNTKKNGNKIDLCNLDMFINDGMVHFFEQSENPASLMIEYLTQLDTNPFAIQKSLGYMVKKEFYAPIREELQADTLAKHRNMWGGEDMYNHLRTGNKSGFLVANKDDELYAGIQIKNRQWRTGIQEYDLNSAYISAIISDDMFPVGKTYWAVNTDKNIVDIFKRCIENMRWFKIFVPAKTTINYKIHLFCKDEKTKDYGIEYYDYLALHDFWNVPDEYFYDLLKQEGVVLYFATGGRLHKKMRERTHEYYMAKSNPEIKGTLFGALAKQKNELIYGKSIQEITYKDFNTVLGRMTDGRNYMQPHMALHCTATVRYRLMKAWYNNADHVTYYDTDSIHGYRLQEYIEIDNAVNDFYNARAGFEGSTIGRWKCEQMNSQELVFAPKQRICLNNGEFIVRVAGIGRKCIEEHIQGMKEKGMTDRAILRHFDTFCFDLVPIPVYHFDVKHGWWSEVINYKEFVERYGEYGEKILEGDENGKKEENRARESL